MEKTEIPGLEDVLAAHKRIASWIHRTPVLTCSAIDKITGGRVFFKCENFQKAGAFKFRGASNAVLSQDREEAGKGVATHSSGNHAAALALAARKRGIRAYIVMPETASDIKKIAVSGYGAEITYCEPTLESREKTLDRLVERTGARFIHPYNNFEVICGQATAAKELAEEVGDLDIVMAPVGGGGLLSGTAISVRNLSPGILVFGAEPKNADDACRSFKSGILQPPLKPDTVADGLLTALGPLTFEIIRKHVDDILCAGEESIIFAMRLIWERMKLIVEPSSSVPLATMLENRGIFKGRRTGIILTGGNVDIDHLPFSGKKIHT